MKNINENKDAKNLTNENKNIFILVVIILVVMLIIYGGLQLINTNTKSIKSTDISDMMKDKKTKIIYVENSNSKKCSKCSEILKHLDKNKINYEVYDVKKYSTKEYEKMLQTLNINPSDFNYPAVIYIKDGVMYSNIINIESTKVVDLFIKDYELKKVK